MRVHLLHTNDLHSHLDQASKVHTLVQTLRKEWTMRGETSFLVDIGDHMDRVRLETEGTDGRVNGAVLTATQYDLITFGNNELLTFSQDQLDEVYRSAPFAVVSSNVIDWETEARPDWLHPWKILVRQGIRFGFLGLTIPYPLVYELMGWKVLDPIETLTIQVKELRKEVDVLILLSHLGLSHDRDLAEKITGIDLILGAHTHHLIDTPECIGETWIGAAGKFGHHLGHVTMELDPITHRITSVDGCCYDLSEEPEAPEIQQLLAKYQKEANDNLAETITVLDEKLLVKYSGESSFANLLADALREWVGTEVALVNSGQLLNHLPSGPVTRRDLHQLCPHPINPVRMQLKGSAIREALEESLLNEYQQLKIRGFGFRGQVLGSLAVSGLRVVYNPDIKNKQKIISIYVGQKPLDEEKEYEVATIDMFTFGSGYLSLKADIVLQYLLPEFLRDLLAYHLRQPNALFACHQKRWFVNDGQKN